MNKTKTIRIFLPSMLCAILIYITNMEISYYPLGFGLIIGIVNWDLHKYNPFFGVLLSVLVSYVSYIIAYFSLAVTGEIADSIFTINSDDSKGVLAFIISPFIIAPILVFLLYKFVFNIINTKLTKLVIIFSIVFLVLQACIFYYTDLVSNDSLENEIFTPYLIWQIVMALAIQIILNQKTSEA
jgi:hypothetical protein